MVDAKNEDFRTIKDRYDEACALVDPDRVAHWAIDRTGFEIALKTEEETRDLIRRIMTPVREVISERN